MRFFTRLLFLTFLTLFINLSTVSSIPADSNSQTETTQGAHVTDTAKNDQEDFGQLLKPGQKEQSLRSWLTDIARGLLGLFVMVLIAFLLSDNKRKVDWKLVSIGLLLQIAFAILVLKVDVAKSFLNGVSGFFVTMLEFSEEGSSFLFGKLTDKYVAFQILPTIVFFSALTSLFYYLNILQRLVYGFAWVMRNTMRLSGAESLAAAANIFIGQTEAPLMVKPYIDKMSRSEIMALMTGGMATIAGGVLAAYISFLGGEDSEAQQLFARHLLTASVMSAPAALLVAKIMVPETKDTHKELLISGESQGANMLDAISYGTTQGLRLAVNVGAMILVFLALMAFINHILQNWIGAPLGWNDNIVAMTGERFEGLNLQFILGYLFAPLAWVIGVPWQDLLQVGQLLGEKTAINEFIAYKSLASMKAEGLLSSESLIIATYALCGFANFGSIGIQIGGIGAIAPSQRTTLSQLALRSLIAGTIACMMTGCIAGMVI